MAYVAAALGFLLILFVLGAMTGAVIGAGDDERMEWSTGSAILVVGILMAGSLLVAAALLALKG